MHRVLDLFTGEIHIKRRHYKLIFNIVGAVSDTDYSARKLSTGSFTPRR